MAPKKGKSPAKSSPPAPVVPLKERAVSAALELSAQMGWDMVTMADIADKSGASLAALSEVFDGKEDILIAYGRKVDRQVLERFGAPDPSMSERDRLFDILMERFDVVNKDRDAVISILKSFAPDPKQAIISLPHLSRSMTWMMEAAGIPTTGLKGAFSVLGISIVYLNVLRVWMKDETTDLSETMAALDKSLIRAEQVANSLRF